ncbi:MAG: hypothetical protein ACR2NJ_01510 [Acidimicrobiales bacterium]
MPQPPDPGLPCPWCLLAPTPTVNTHRCPALTLMILAERTEHERTGPSRRPGGSWSSFMAAHPELLTDDDDLPEPF